MMFDRVKAIDLLLKGDNMPDVIRFDLAIPEADIAELRSRLAATRWPEQETVEDWSQGVPLAKLQALTDYWRNGYDWRRCEAMLNGFGQYRTVLDGLAIHFLHIRSPESAALPLLITHGWPGSVIEFHKIIGPLTNPAAHGGDAADAFHLVIPSLPGFGFSDRPKTTGWNVQRIATAWDTLMTRLNYRRYVAQGGDWGAVITTALGAAKPSGLAAIHLNMPYVVPTQLPEFPTPEEQAALGRLAQYNKWGSAYGRQQSSRPQTLGYGLADSPAGQAAWIYEKFYAWSDCGGDLETLLTRDEMLDNIMLYWLTNTATSSARLYWETAQTDYHATKLTIPVGCSIFPKEIFPAPRQWAEQFYDNIIYWNELDRGGHFAAFEQPILFVDELRACFRQFR